MAEELRYFVRTAIWLAGAGTVYWVVSQEPAGTVLLFFALVSILAFVGVGAAFAPRALAGLRGGSALGFVNRLIGFDEPPDAVAPLEGGPEVVPLASPWPVVTAAALVVIGLGLVFGVWLVLPGIALLVLGGIGWLTQLDRPT